MEQESKESKTKRPRKSIQSAEFRPKEAPPRKAAPKLFFC
jgi:hypothetical protein